ncbi:MAG TPA: hypothetical protein VLA73_04610, partial [Burkholderiales bacterium]|nr:hypothetical protein [Burkholderiales bacterium]
GDSEPKSGCVGSAAREHTQALQERMEQLSDQLAQRPAADMSPRGTLASPPSRLYLFSDGVYEVRKSDGSMLPFEEFLDVMVRPVAAGESELTACSPSRALHGGNVGRRSFRSRQI